MSNPKTILRNPLEERLGYQLRRASTAMMAALAQKLAELGLTITEASIMVLIEANPAVSQTEIGHVLAIKRANMAPLVAGLMEQNLVERDAIDGRSQALHLTANGENLARGTWKLMLETEQSFLNDLSKKEIAIWRKRLEEIWAR